MFNANWFVRNSKGPFIFKSEIKHIPNNTNNEMKICEKHFFFLPVIIQG